jgi:hypothetical protein
MLVGYGLAFIKKIFPLSHLQPPPPQCFEAGGLSVCRISAKPSKGNATLMVYIG